MNRYFFVIFNANAGRSRAGAQERLQAYFTGRDLCTSFSTIDTCDWRDVSRRLAAGDDVRFVVAGGDGTLRLTLERLWERKLLDACSVAFVPLGSANVAALSLGIPMALPQALDTAVNGTPRPVDLGLIDNRHVFFIAAIFGAVSDVTVGAHRDIKKRFGALAYVMSIGQLLRNDYRKQAFTLAYRDGGSDREINSHSMIICNHLNLGWLRPRRNILLDDKRLDLITLHNTRFWGLMTAAWEFWRGRTDSRVLRHRSFDKAIYRLKDFKGQVHLDGDECLGLSDTIDMRVMPHAARFVS